MDQVAISRQLKVHDGLDIMWSGEVRICSKQLKHYPALWQDKTTIAVCSFVMMTSKDEQKRYLAYLEDLYEDINGEKMVRVRWFYHNEEVKNMIPELNDAEPNEVLITPHVQDRISIKCIDGIATVLSPYHYEKCSPIFPKELSMEIFICHREFKCNKKIIKPFPIIKLRGYNTQGLLCRNLLSFLLQQHSDVSIEEEKCPPSFCPARQSSNRRTRSRRRKYTEPERFCPAAVIANSSILENCIEESKQPDGPGSNQVAGAEPPSRISYSMFDQENQHIEILSQDSGMRGCWFKCKILRASKRNIRVQYFDIEDADGNGKLEEWIPTSRVAVPDKLGMRCAGRLTVRPWQPPHNASDCSFEVGDAVDAWRGDGWWEGVVVSNNNSGSDYLEVYFSGENEFVTLQKKNLRPSRDWVDKKWVKVEAKRDIISAISLLRSSSGDASKLTVSENGSQQLPSLDASADPKKYVPALNPKKRLLINYLDHAVFKEPSPRPNVQLVAKETPCSRRKLYKNNRCVIMVD